MKPSPRVRWVLSVLVLLTASFAVSQQPPTESAAPDSTQAPATQAPGPEANSQAPQAAAQGAAPLRVMALALAILLFLTIALVVFSFGAAAYAPFSVLGSRLRALGWQKAQPQEKPAFKDRLEQALDPLSRALPLSPSEVSRTRKWLIQAGYREPRHLTIYVGARVLLALVGLVSVIAVKGNLDLLLMIGVGGFGFFIPRFVLKRRIRSRQRRITLALPDALDLTVICVEVGLALDQALMRVGEDLRHADSPRATSARADTTSAAGLQQGSRSPSCPAAGTRSR